MYVYENLCFILSVYGLALCCCDYYELLFSFNFCIAKSSPHFDDVPSSYWAYDAIMEAAEAGIVFGFGDGTFQPNSPVTYAQFSALLGRAFYPSELDFSDYDSWYEPYTIVLSEHNVLLNLESDKLDNSLSIFDMAQLLYNVLVDYCIFSPSDPPFISSLDNLHLLDNIPSEYHSAIRTIYSLGLLDDFFDLFSTGDIRISRAQACIVINRLSSYLTPGNKTTLSGLIIGGQLTVSETTPIDAKILLSNAGCDVFSYSAILALKYYKEGSWVDIPFNSPDNTVSEVAILHQLMPGQEKVFTFDLSYYYGSISEGYYKLEIVLTQNGKTTLYRISFYQQLIYVQLTLSGKRTWNNRIPSPLFLYLKIPFKSYS